MRKSSRTGKPDWPVWIWFVAMIAFVFVVLVLIPAIKFGCDVERSPM
jgi:hypothetical protein